MDKDMKIYIAGHKGMVGTAIWNTLKGLGHSNLLGMGSDELDLRNQAMVNEFFISESPDIVIDAAARVGGILANHKHPYLFLMENLQIQNNLIDSAHRHGVKKFIFLGSSCIYPKLAPQPMKETHLLTGSLEPTNEWYALAKIAGVKACQAIREQFGKDFISLMPTNLYGPNDNFDLETSHVLPAMIRKFHLAKENNNAPVTLWGSGTPKREFLHVNDLAKAVIFAMERILPDSIYNVGTGTDISIIELAEIIQKVVGHTGEIQWDSSKPDGTPRKLLDVSNMNALGWKHEIELKEGIRITYKWFLKNREGIREVKLV